MRSNAVTLVSNSRNEKHVFCSDGIYVWCVHFTLFITYVEHILFLFCFLDVTILSKKYRPVHISYLSRSFAFHTCYL